MIPINVKAAHHYIWSDTNFCYWLDDHSVISTNNKNWAAFTMILEDMRSGETVRFPDPVFVYRSDKNMEWYISSTIGSELRLIDEDEDWWEPYAIKWLIKNNYVEKKGN
jgi:hypothetical protein